MAQTSTRNHAQRGNHQQYARMTLLNPQQHVVPTAALTKSKLVPVTAARPVTTAVSKTHLTRPRPVGFRTQEHGVLGGLHRKGFGEVQVYGRGKFNGKVDEGFLVGYSVSSKAFRVFNSRTRIIQETLHINFLENKPNVASSSPTWLFDINTLTKTMNYQPVTTGNQSNPSAGVQEQFDAEKAGDESVQQYVIFSCMVFCSVQTKKHDEKTKREAKGNSPIESLTGYRNLSADFEDLSDNSINEVNAADSPVPVVGHILTNSTKTFSGVGPSNTVVSPTHGKYSYVNTSQYPNDPNMPELEYITYSNDEEDVGA
uniref:Retrovirus-related Pol polyprotein from transposon TNT 1-94 n=1 Tax=Tanacetum cinerariifolium TaxID=118510 RepID=A0A6L2KFP4_TANCI|nr:retrovirus-related Pol polyprotein from transposon TNT 1-94 [Tanacetum cinerariifolium]